MFNVYDKSETNFNTDGKGELIHFTDRPIVTERPGYLELRFQYDMNGLNAKWLKKGDYVKTTPNHTQKPIPFYIHTCEPDTVSETVEVEARAKPIQDVMDRSIPEYEFGGVPLQTALNQAKGLMTAPYTGSLTTDNVRVSVKQKYADSTAYAVLFSDDNSLMKITRSEQEFTTNGIIFRAVRGKKKAAVIRKGSALMQHFKLKYEQTDEFCTRIIPFTTVMSDYLNEKDERKTNKSKEYGTPIVSPAVEKYGLPVVTRYVEFKNETLEERKKVQVKRKRKPTKRKRKTPYTTPDTKEKILYQYKYEDIEDLNDDAEDFFEKHPSVAYEKITATLDMAAMDATTDTFFGMYDTVEVYSEKYDIDVELRVEEVEWNPLTEQVVRVKFTNDYDSVKLAERLLNEGRPSSHTLSVQSEERNFEYNLLNYIEDADGRHIMYHLTELPDPNDYEIGDIVFLDNGGKTEIWEKAETGWVRTMSGEVSDEVRREIEKVKEEVDNAKVSLTEWKETDLPALLSDIKRLDDSQKLSIGLIGNDNTMIYTKNRIQEELDTRKPVTITVEQGSITIRHNGSGFTTGQQYTLAGVTRFVERPHRSFLVRTRRGGSQIPTEVVMQPKNQHYPTLTKTGGDVTFDKVYLDDYRLTCHAEGYYPVVVRVDVTETSTSHSIELEPLIEHVNVSVEGDMNRVTVQNPVMKVQAVPSTTHIEWRLE